MKLHERMRLRRLVLRLNQDQLADLAGVSRPTINRLETGMIVSRTSIEKVEKALDEAEAKKSRL